MSFSHWKLTLCQSYDVISEKCQLISCSLLKWLTTFVLCSQSPLHWHYFWVPHKLQTTAPSSQSGPSEGILHGSECCLFHQQLHYSRWTRHVSTLVFYKIKVSRSQNKIVEPQILPKKRTKKFVYSFVFWENMRLNNFASKSADLYLIKYRCWHMSCSHAAVKL